MVIHPVFTTTVEIIIPIVVVFQSLLQNDQMSWRVFFEDTWGWGLQAVKNKGLLHTSVWYKWFKL